MVFNFDPFGFDFIKVWHCVCVLGLELVHVEIEVGVVSIVCFRSYLADVFEFYERIFLWVTLIWRLVSEV